MFDCAPIDGEQAAPQHPYPVVDTGAPVFPAPAQPAGFQPVGYSDDEGSDGSFQDLTPVQAPYYWNDR
jgi:hypothetical protein